jgi:cyclomaltodextrinase / maltogenic alpha-amylase / neopullulanase
MRPTLHPQGRRIGAGLPREPVKRHGPGRLIAPLLLCAHAALVFSQADSVDVTFRYKTLNAPSAVYVAGEFNQWAHNQSGRISDPSAAMEYDPASGTWAKTLRLRVGGPESIPDPGRSIQGAYQYKFNENGAVDGWKPDPLNPRQNPGDMNNSLVYPRNPTLLYLFPNRLTGPALSQFPEISIDVFPAIGYAVDESGFRVSLDGNLQTDGISAYDAEARRFRFIPARGLSNGPHGVKIEARCPGGSFTADSAEFIVQAGAVRMLTRSDLRFLRPEKRIDGIVEDSGISEAVLFRNSDSVRVPAARGRFSCVLALTEGDNRIRAEAEGGSGRRSVSDSIIVRYWIEHAPRPSILQSLNGKGIRLTARGNDPDGDRLQFEWSSAVSETAFLTPSVRDSVAEFSNTAFPGEYNISVTATDPSGNRGRAEAFFTVLPDGSLRAEDDRSNPSWVADAVVYEIFLPSFTAEGTLAAAGERLPLIRALGANTIWLMPLYDNGETINELNAGYNITDFRRIHPQLGDSSAFRRFVDSAHELGLRVILDSTPNHVSENHPWVREVAVYGEYAVARPIVEDRLLGDNRGLGQNPAVKDGAVVYVHYDGWTLANLNYRSDETRFEMLDMYGWWLDRMAVDGFRMDVYWGPENRYGRAAWWRPFREEIKRTHPTAFILGETDGTGPGTETNYADGGGACDAAYDWNFYGEVKRALAGGSIDDLDGRVRNFSPTSRYNHFTGPHAKYFRFLENHDETRIAGLFSAERTRAAAALLLTAPGVPMIYAGQEAGETSRRGKIDWNRPGASNLAEWYRRLLSIRGGFAAFRSDEILRVPAASPGVYAFLRPDTGMAALSVVNFSERSGNVRLSVDTGALRVHGEALTDGKSYFLSDVLNDTAYGVSKNGLAGFSLAVRPYGAAVLILSDSRVWPPDAVPPEPKPGGAKLASLEAYPNPFRSGTTFLFTTRGGGGLDTASLTVCDLLGNRVAALFREAGTEGAHRVDWDGMNQAGAPAASGVYVCRLKIGAETRCIKVTRLR